MIDLGSPYAVIAQYFMIRKGYPEVIPYAMEPLEGTQCAYFYYHLPEGDLELEVSWDHRSETWNTLVTLFTLAE